MTMVRERFNPVPMAAGSTYQVRGPHLGGFLAKTSGTITVTSRDASGVNTVTLVDAVPVTAGIYTPIPILFPATNDVVNGAVTLGGGASGTLMV